jgi:hypothetical protein
MQGSGKQAMLSSLPLGFAIRRYPAALCHMIGQAVKVKPDPILDHSIHVEQISDFRDIPEKQNIKRPDKCF